jgi:hypothetical protein
MVPDLSAFASMGEEFAGVWSLRNAWSAGVSSWVRRASIYFVRRLILDSIVLVKFGVKSCFYKLYTGVVTDGASLKKPFNIKYSSPVQGV